MSFHIVFSKTNFKKIFHNILTLKFRIFVKNKKLWVTFRRPKNLTKVQHDVRCCIVFTIYDVLFFNFSIAIFHQFVPPFSSFLFSKLLYKYTRIERYWCILLNFIILFSLLLFLTSEKVWLRRNFLFFGIFWGFFTSNWKGKLLILNRISSFL